ncbi:MFS transporter [Coralliovum pocilloporae]|uniref:MFS transporter n=1 Tax=Coralliovum pocilloporae TaxID=3066369 RepID=UPI003307B5B6
MTLSASPPAADKQAVIPLLAAVASITSVGMGLSLMSPLLSLVLEAKGFSDSLIGLNTMIGAIGALVSTLITTTIARHIGVSLTMILTPFLTAGLVLSLYFISWIPAWFPIRFAIVFGLTVHFILSEFWIVSGSASHRRGFWMAIYATSLSVGFAIGTLTLSLTGSQGVLPFAICAGLILFGAVPAILARHHAPRLEREQPTQPLKYFFMVPLAIFAVGVFAFSESSVMAMMPLYGLGTGHVESDASLLLTAVMLGGVVFQLPIGFLSDRMDRRVLLTAIALVGTAGLVFLPFVITSFWAAVTILFVWGGITAGLYTVGLAHLGSRLTGNALAGANSAFVLSYSLGMIIGPPLSGIVLDVSPVYGFPLLSAAAFLTFFLYAAHRLRVQPVSEST